MPISDISDLRRRIDAEQLRWTARTVDPHVRFGLGADPSPVALATRAEAEGTQLLTVLRDQRPDAILNSRIRIDDIWRHLRLRPRRWDWRDRGVVGPVTDQGQCGSCVSFATAGVVGTQTAIEHGGVARDLSEADQHFESNHGANCGGWNAASSLAEVQRRRIATEGVFPYMSAFDAPPQFGADGLWIAHARPEVLRPMRSYGITEYTAHSGDDRKDYLSTVGPLMARFAVFQDFDNYSDGIYSHTWGTLRGYHEVMVIGYDDDRGAWIARNSWGTTAWSGPAAADGTGAGFFEIAYGDSSIDDEPFYGARGVLMPALIPIHKLEPIDRRIPVLQG